MPSWRLHVEQDPQSPRPVIRKSTSGATPVSVVAGAGALASGTAREEPQDAPNAADIMSRSLEIALGPHLPRDVQHGGVEVDPGHAATGADRVGSSARDDGVAHALCREVERAGDVGQGPGAGLARLNAAGDRRRLIQHFVLDVLRQRAGIADADRAAIARQVEPECVQVIGEAGLGELDGG